MANRPFTQEQRIACKHIHDLLEVAIRLAEQEALMVIAGEMRKTADGIKADIQRQREAARVA